MTKYEILVNGLREFKNKLEDCQSKYHECYSCHYILGYIESIVSMAALLGEKNE